MSNQMTTPINTIPVDNNVQPNNDIQDPLVQEILDNMAKSSEKPIQPIQPVQVNQPPIQVNQQPIQVNQQPVYNYPTQNEGFIAKFYDTKIIILTLLIVALVIVFHLNQFDDFVSSIQNHYVQEYKFYLKYILLYLILYCVIKKNNIK